MKHCALLLTVLLFTAAVTFPQTAPTRQLSDFAGTWKAEFKKQTWLVLTLAPAKVGLSGTLVHSVQLSADDEGDLTRVDDEMSTDKIVNAQLEGDTLEIRTRDEDNNEDTYRLALTGKDTAELQTAVPEGSSAPKPFKLKRAIEPPK